MVVALSAVICSASRSMCMRIRQLASRSLQSPAGKGSKCCSWNEVDWKYLVTMRSISVLSSYALYPPRTHLQTRRDSYGVVKTRRTSLRRDLSSSLDPYLPLHALYTLPPLQTLIHRHRNPIRRNLPTSNISPLSRLIAKVLTAYKTLNPSPLANALLPPCLQSSFTIPVTPPVALPPLVCHLELTSSIGFVTHAASEQAETEQSVYLSVRGMV